MQAFLPCIALILAARSAAAVKVIRKGLEQTRSASKGYSYFKYYILDVEASWDDGTSQGTTVELSEIRLYNVLGEPFQNLKADLISFGGDGSTVTADSSTSDDCTPGSSTVDIAVDSVSGEFEEDGSFQRSTDCSTRRQCLACWQLNVLNGEKRQMLRISTPALDDFAVMAYKLELGGRRSSCPLRWKLYGAQDGTVRKNLVELDAEDWTVMEDGQMIGPFNSEAFCKTFPVPGFNSRARSDDIACRRAKLKKELNLDAQPVARAPATDEACKLSEHETHTGGNTGEGIPTTTTKTTTEAGDESVRTVAEGARQAALATATEQGKSVSDIVTAAAMAAEEAAFNAGATPAEALAIAVKAAAKTSRELVERAGMSTRDGAEVAALVAGKIAAEAAEKQSTTEIEKSQAAAQAAREAATLAGASVEDITEIVTEVVSKIAADDDEAATTTTTTTMTTETYTVKWVAYESGGFNHSGEVQYNGSRGIEFYVGDFKTDGCIGPQDAPDGAVKWKAEYCLKLYNLRVLIARRSDTNEIVSALSCCNNQGRLVEVTGSGSIKNFTSSGGQ
eukprot:TRINITY_DN16965_c0_g1_i7.p1 TRINITY_DN16965_c0_g1~~TRINITY_DN16965_c0_g1_i7.p1  ORF type:complete len:564 (+),score=115.81 TRINITY_DN16965_c0_g1_i7:35-1726(+)